MSESGHDAGAVARPMPKSVLVAAAIAILFLALLALEISDGLTRHGGRIARSVYVFPPVVALLWGILTHRRWAWLACRGTAFLFGLVFTGVGVVACVARPTDQYGAVLDLDRDGELRAGVVPLRRVLRARSPLGEGPLSVRMSGLRPTARGAEGLLRRQGDLPWLRAELVSEHDRRRRQAL